MFDDIAQMEQEIEVFRKNIAASSELVSSIEALAQAEQEHSAAFSADSEKLLRQMDACIAQFRSDHNSALDQMQQNISADMTQWIAVLTMFKDAMENCASTTATKTDEQIRSFTGESERLLSEMKNELVSQQEAYAARLRQSEEAIRGYQTEAGKKYDQFVQRIEAANTDQLYREVQELKKSVQTKFTILMAGIGAAVLAAVLSIILK